MNILNLKKYIMIIDDHQKHQQETIPRAFLGT